MNQTRIRLRSAIQPILSEEVDRRTVQKRSVARQDPVRTTIAAAGTETTGLSNPGVCYVINTHESFNRICYDCQFQCRTIRRASPNLNEVPPNSAAYVIDFFEARHRLLTESERIAQESAIDREIQEPAIRRARSVGLVDALEEAFYWLILASGARIFGPWDLRPFKLHSACEDSGS